MKFRLTYEGSLRPDKQRSRFDQVQRQADHKHAIRRVFHSQLKELWRTNGFLSSYRRPAERGGAIEMRPVWQSEAWFGADDEGKVPFHEYIAGQFLENGYRFVPLVCDEFAVACSLEVLFLRRDPPGSAIQGGDIDNRLKTLIDALRKPHGPGELGGATEPLDGEDPFFVLLQDDKLIDHFAVETDTLLTAPTVEPIEAKADAKIVVTVTLRPYAPSFFNLAFV